MPRNWKTFAQEKESAEPEEEEPGEEPTIFGIDDSAETEGEQITGAEKNKSLGGAVYEGEEKKRKKFEKNEQIPTPEKDMPTGGAVYGGKDEKGEKSKKSK